MPWIDKETCTSCGICAEECPVDAIAIENDGAEIDMNECISCAICHNICPVEAIRHNSERVEFWINEKIDDAQSKLKQCQEILEDPNTCDKSLGRIIHKYRMMGNIFLSAAEKLEDIKQKKEG